jgi:glycosyltransferase involved in cell wall biosynthesis
VTVDVVIPVLNEAHVVGRNVRRLHETFTATLPYDWALVVAENGSSDGTADAVLQLAATLPRVSALILDRPGRGGALRAAWSQSRADIVAYTDVDLSTDPAEFLPLLAALHEGGYDVATGSRLLAGSQTRRSRGRQLISRGYNRLLSMALKVGFSDAQTGFKAVTREIVERVLPLVVDNAWFLDTELLVLSERLGYRIADLPIRWVEDEDSRVRIIRTAWEDLKGIARVRRFLRSHDGRARLSAVRAARTYEGAVR